MQYAACIARKPKKRNSRYAMDACMTTVLVCRVLAIHGLVLTSRDIFMHA